MRNSSSYAGGPKPQGEVTPLLLLLQFCYLTIQYNFSACKVPPDAGLQKRPGSSHAGPLERHAVVLPTALSTTTPSQTYD
jgi:hypothetical protein